MAHTDKIKDTETHFTIDPTTRTIATDSSGNNIIVQYDHNSERFTFEIPRYVDGHDMSESTEVRIHYRNASSNNLSKTNGVYIPDDVVISEDDENMLTFSWLLSSATTQYIGYLHFSIQFVCLNGDTVEYAWNTGIYKDVTVIESINNAEVIVEQYPDVLEQWRQELFDAGGDAVVNVNTAEANALSAIEAKGAETIDSIPDDYTELVRVVDENTQVTDENRCAIIKTGEIVSRNEKRITNLEQGLPDDTFAVDESVAYIKEVPENALPYAEVAKVGGMTRKSKNLFIPSQVNKTALGLTFSYENGLVKINGTKASGSNIQSVAYPKIILPAGTYTLSLKMVGGSITDTPDRFLGVYFGINQSTYERRTTPAVAKVGDVGKRVFTLSEPTVISTFDITPDYDTYGFVCNNALFEMQLEEGDTVTTYEDGFEGLRDASVTEVKSVGANIWDEVWQTGFIETGSGVNASSAVRMRSKNYIPCESETVYSINRSTDDTIFYCYDKDKKFLGVRYAYAQRITTYANSCYMRFVTSADYGAVYKNDIIIAKGATALTYSPYQEHTLQIPEAVQALDGFGWSMSESVYNYIDWEKKQFVKRVEKLTLNGSNVAWTSYGSTVLYNANLMNNAKKYNNSAVYALCSDIPYTANAKYLNSYFIARVSNDNGLQFNNVLDIYGLSENTSAAFNAYLAEHPMTFVYELAEPIVTDISDLITDDNLIGVEPYGTLTFENEYEYGVPSEVTYQIKGVTA